MSTIENEISGVLAQIRALSTQINTSDAHPVAESEGFGAAMRSAVDSVSAQQEKARVLTESFAAGDRDTSIAEVIVEMQKASISFQAMSEARNRIVDAYREIMNMSV